MSDASQALDEVAEFNHALVSSNKTRWAASILDAGTRDELHKIEFSEDGSFDGQVDLDCSAQIAQGGQGSGSIWSAELTAIAPKSLLGLAGRLFLNNLIKIEHSIWLPTSKKWKDTTVFCGPSSAPVITGHTMSLEGQGMEARWRRDIRRPRTWKAGTNVCGIIRDIAANELGEPDEYVDVPNLPDVLEDPYQAKLDLTWYDVIQYLGESINADTYPARNSTLTLRPRPTQLAYLIPAAAILGIPQSSVLIGAPGAEGVDLSAVLNRFVVAGKALPQKPPEHGKPPKPPLIVGIWNIPAWHPLSAQRLGTKEHPLWLKDVYGNDHIHDDATANRIAEARGRRAMQMAEQLTFETVTIPHIEPYQSYQLAAAGVGSIYELIRATNPLRPGDGTNQSWGFWQDGSEQPRRHRG